MKTLILGVMIILAQSPIDVYGSDQMTNTFKIESWNEVPYLEFSSGAKYSKASLIKKYTGDIVGQGRLEYLMTYNESGRAYFTGIEHLEGEVAGKAGAFSIVHEGTFVGGSVESTFRVVDGSQSGALIGLRGKGSFKAGHSMLVNFSFEHSFSIE